MATQGSLSLSREVSPIAEIDAEGEVGPVAALNEVNNVWLDDFQSEDSEDPVYKPQLNEVSEGDEDIIASDEGEGEGEGDDQGEGDDLLEPEIEHGDSSDDDDVNEARKKIVDWNANVLKIAQELEKQKKLIGSKEGQGEGGNVNDEQREGFVSDYDESGDEIDTHIEDESWPGHRIKTDILVVNELTDFKKLKWVVGMRFPSREIGCC